MSMKTSDNGIKLLQQFEGCRLKAYNDMQPSVTITAIGQVKGTLTIGYGHTGSDVYVGQTITKATAINLLKQDLAKFEKIVNNKLKVPITQNMFDALVSHAYNCGNANTIISYLNNGDFTNALAYCLKPNTSGGVVLAGLTKRRTAERDLFATDMYLQPTARIDKTSNKLYIRWLQTKLGLTVDGCWGTKTTTAVAKCKKQIGANNTDGTFVGLPVIKKLS